MGTLPRSKSEMTVADARGWVGAGFGQAQPFLSPGVLEQNVLVLLHKYMRLHCLSDLLDPYISDHT